MLKMSSSLHSLGCSLRCLITSPNILFISSRALSRFLCLYNEPITESSCSRSSYQRFLVSELKYTFPNTFHPARAWVSRNLNLTLFRLYRRKCLATPTSSNCYFHCQRVGRNNQISECCHITTVNWIASCVETSQSYPFNAIVDRSITLL